MKSEADKPNESNSTTFRAFVPESEREAAAERRDYTSRVLRSFFAFVGEDPAPLVSLPVGALYITKDRREFVEGFFLGRLHPLDPAIEAEAEYIVRREHRILADGKYLVLRFADVVQLTAVEAAPLLRARIVAPINPKSFRI